MSSDVLVLGAMLVTVVATFWWALTPERVATPNRLRVAKADYDAKAA